MYFCEKCNAAHPVNVCPDCHSRGLREVEPDDYCFLTEREVMWADMLRAALADVDIESAYRPVFGAAMSVSMGKALERHQIYVPYDCYEAALAVMFSLFGETRQSRSHSPFGV